jgi:hypothetical protein
LLSQPLLNFSGQLVFKGRQRLKKCHTHFDREIAAYNLQLPTGVKLRIVELSGLSHQADIENLSLLKTCDRTLFLFTYNSAETASD